MSSSKPAAAPPRDAPPPPPSSSSDEAEQPAARNPYASQNRWRHQESSAYARHAANAGGSGRNAVPREADEHGGVQDLADFLNRSRIAPPPPSSSGGTGAGGEGNSSGAAAAAGGRVGSAGGRYKPITIAAAEAAGDGASESKAGALRPEESGLSGTTGRAGSDVRSDGLREVVCGPLLNFRRMELAEGGGGTWRWYGSVLVVTKGGGKNAHEVQAGQEEGPALPVLTLRRVGQVTGDGRDVDVSFETEASGALGLSGGGEGTNGAGASEAVAGSSTGKNAAAHTNGVNGAAGVGGPTSVQGVCLYSDPRNTFWAFALALDTEPGETKWEYGISGVRYRSKTQSATCSFFAPASAESMRIMFHSCNGFSVGTDEDAWSGPALWNDVLRRHRDAPFHVMIGGGDQIYNDGIRVSGPLRDWTAIGNPRKRREEPYPEKLRQACDDYYLKNYIRWYSTEPFATANGQIPQLNIWDDHDIIDGFGSYVDQFMRCDVFRGIGGTAHKYYRLFQHHLPPPPSTYTSDIKDAPSDADGTQGLDPNQLMNAYCAPEQIESNYIIGLKPGPYVAEHSHNMYARLGARIAFLGIDARTERTRHQINYPETYDVIFDRLRSELGAASKTDTPIKHLVLLLGIPIAYPRLTWLENIINSPLIGPIKFLNRRFGLGGGIFNHFDGSVDLLDDLDDHYTARTHKKERHDLMERLQAVSQEFSVRITILGGDVHLAALGRFYSAPSLRIPAEHDHRYMANVVSSAIVNKPPPQAIANLLARRNKIHHLDHSTDETLMKLFDKDPGGVVKNASYNKVTMPSRNFSILTENSPNRPATNGAAAEAAAAPAPASPAPTPAPAPAPADPTTSNPPSAAPPPPGSSGGGGGGGTSRGSGGGSSTGSGTTTYEGAVAGKSGHHPLHGGEVGAGTSHRAASEALHGRGPADGSLDVCIRVEVDQHDPDGRTEKYGMTVPTLSPMPPQTAAAAAADGGVQVNGASAEHHPHQG